MVPVITLLVVLIVSMVIVRVATVALTLTGLSSELARFQARSAFSGTGFTTSESEKVLQHPVRRRIIMTLMLVGSAGIATVLATLIASFVNVRQVEGLWGTYWFRFLILLVGLGSLWFIAQSRWLDRHMSHLIARLLRRWTNLEALDYAGLLHLTGGYVVIELRVEPHDWLAERTLAELELSHEGVLVLGVEKRDGTYLGAPRGITRLAVGDNVIMYGRKEVLTNLDQRRAGAAGNVEHQKTVSEQQQIEEAEAQLQE